MDRSTGRMLSEAAELRPRQTGSIADGRARPVLLWSEMTRGEPTRRERSMTLAIETRNLTRYFDDFCAVSGIDLAVERGTFYGFLGPNGAGKSTTIKML